MLRDDRNEPLQTTQDRTMDDNGPRRGLVCGSLAVLGGAVLQLEPFGELEVKLNRCALERSAQRVFDRDIDFRAIESTVSRVELPFAGVVFVESVCQLLETSLLGVFATAVYEIQFLKFAIFNSQF